MIGLQRFLLLLTISIISILILFSALYVFTNSTTIKANLNQAESDNYEEYLEPFNATSEILEMIVQVNESTLEHHIRTIQDFGPHPTGSKALENVKQYIYTELLDSGLSVKYDSWRYKLRQGENIEATHHGIGSSDGIIILCAHYDSLYNSPGADDDGSGVSAVLTIAKIMSNYEFNSTIKFILFSGEEQGLYGSHEYAKDSFQRKDNILGVINLDGISYATSKTEEKNIRNLVEEDAYWINDISMDIVKTFDEYIDLNIIKMPNVVGSDHNSFIEFGYQASYFFEYSITPYYHTTKDTIDHVNTFYLKKISRLVLGTLAKMAEIDRVLNNQDIKISYKGSLLSRPDYLNLRIQNTRYSEDSANLTITVKIKNLFTGSVIEGPYGGSANWIFNEEIDEVWEFNVAKRKHRFELIRFEVTVEGFNDDIGLYKKSDTIGVAFQKFVLMVPKF